MKLAVLVVISILICNMAMADNISKAENSGASKAVRGKVKSSFDTSAFDDKLERLPLHYNGHSIALFQETILSNEVIAKGKSEFETAAVYEERKKKVLESIKFENMSLNSRWAFMFTPNIVGGYLKYDPEHSQFSQHFYVQHNSNNSSPIPSFFLEEKRRDVGSYIAQNAMGATAKVIKKDVLIRGLQITQCQRNNPDFGGSNYIGLDEGGLYVHTFSMPPEQAQKQKSQLRYLFIVNSFMDPYVVAVNDHYSPEFPDELFDTTARTITTFSKVDAVWLYNYETGEIIEKVAPCSIQQEKGKLDKGRSVLNYLF